MTEPEPTIEVAEADHRSLAGGRNLIAALLLSCGIAAGLGLGRPLLAARIAGALPWRGSRAWAIDQAYSAARNAPPTDQAECCELIATQLGDSPNSTAWIKLNLILTRAPRPPELTSWLKSRRLELMAQGERDHGTYLRVAVGCFAGLESDPRFVQAACDRLLASPDNAFLQSLIRQFGAPAARELAKRWKSIRVHPSRRAEFLRVMDTGCSDGWPFYVRDDILACVSHSDGPSDRRLLGFLGDCRLTRAEIDELRRTVRWDDPEAMRTLEYQLTLAEKALETE